MKQEIRFFKEEAVALLKEAIQLVYELQREANLSNPKTGVKIVVTRTNSGYQSYQEPQNDFRQSILLKHQLETKKEFSDLIKLIEQFHPEINWVQTIIGGSLFSFTDIILSASYDLVESNENITSEIIDKKIKEIDEILSDKKMTIHQITLIKVSSTTPPVHVNINITPKIKLRSLTDIEFTKMFSYSLNNWQTNEKYQFLESIGGNDVLLLEGFFETEVSFEASSQSANNIKSLNAFNTMNQSVEDAINIIHLYSEGALNISATFYSIHNSSAFNLNTSYKSNNSLGYAGTYILDNKDIFDLERLSARVCYFYYKDDLLKWIIKFQSISRQTPQAELSFLYDVRDALKSRFKDDRGITEKTKVSREKVRTLTELANNEIFEGRHKGQNYKKIRNAKPEELVVAKSITKSLILGYLSFLEDNKK